MGVEKPGMTRELGERGGLKQKQTSNSSKLWINMQRVVVSIEPV